MIHFLNCYKFLVFILLFGTKYSSRNMYNSFSERITVLFLGYSSLFTTTETGLRSTQHRTEWTHRGCFPGVKASTHVLQLISGACGFLSTCFHGMMYCASFAQQNVCGGGILIIYDPIYASSRWNVWQKC